MPSNDWLMNNFLPVAMIGVILNTLVVLLVQRVFTRWSSMDDRYVRVDECHARRTGCATAAAARRRIFVRR
ncbi:MAG: hypothetical protein MZV70_64135 [Desulfobacterales bacterium]|nr:hypothetical protein [Desulfobacterales bacterium]